MKEIPIIPGPDGTDEAAFCPDKMAEAGLDSISLSTALSKCLAPFAQLLADGRGLGVLLQGEEASIVGIRTDDQST